MQPTSELRFINSLIERGVLLVLEYVRPQFELVFCAIRAPVFLSLPGFFGIVNCTDQEQTRLKAGTQSHRSKAKNATTAGLPGRLLHLERLGRPATRRDRDKYGTSQWHWGVE